MPSQLMIYGANGFTGRLIAKEAAARGLQPILAGRNREQIEALGRELGCKTRVFDLAGDVAAQLSGVSVVLHCAGPYIATSEPMLAACIKTRAHYLDITGEIYVFQRIYAMDAELKAAGIMAVPGVGFDVVPTEGVAVLLKERMPDATRVRVVMRADRPAMSRGTLKSSIEILPQGTLVREDGELRPAPARRELQSVEFRDGSFKVVPFTAGELMTIHRSTGIANIEVGMAGTPEETKPLVQLQKLSGLMRFKAARWLLQRLVDATAKDPTATDIQTIRSHIRGDAWTASGVQLTLFLDIPQGYAFTAISALACVQRALAPNAPTGALAPSQLTGSAALLALPGVVLHEHAVSAQRVD